MGLGKYDVSTVLAVKDLAKAREFYEQVLGFTDVVKADEYQVLYKSGDAIVEIYASGFAGTNKATAATWAVDDIKATVDELKTKGVDFEHYDMPEVTLDGDVHNMGPEKAAWFKDPDGNILCLHQ